MSKFEYLYNDEEESDRISINSIVSENINFDSDNEAPEDKFAQVDKIIKNHVVKHIIIPGKGLSKPSRFDFIKIRYKCYFQALKHFKEEKIVFSLIDKSDTEYNDYLSKLKFPSGIMKAIQFMRLGEKSRIVLRPKHGFKKIKNEYIKEFFDGDIEAIIKHYQEDSPNYSKEDFINDLKTKTLIYEIQLMDFVKIYDISGNQTMMKQIIVQGEGLVKPFENNHIELNYKIYINNNLFKHGENLTIYLNENNFNEGEITIIKSMKKNEMSRVDIQNEYFGDVFLNNSRLFDKKQFYEFVSKLENSNRKCEIENELGEYKSNTLDYFNKKENNFENMIDEQKEQNFNNNNNNIVKKIRITYEIELIKLKNNKSFNNYKNIVYEKTSLCNGIGKICPWDRSLLKFLLKIQINDNVVYCDDFKELKEDEIEFARKIKDIKKIIKTKTNYLNKIQFFIDDLIREKVLVDSEIYDPIKRNLPDLIYEIIKTMKILQVENIKFTIEKEKNKQEFIKLKNLELNLSKDNLFENKDLTFNITICLLNFQENYSIFNQNFILWDEATKFSKLNEYKNESNFYFSKENFRKAKQINKFLVVEYTKYLNVDKSKTAELLMRNKDDFIKPEIKFEFLNDEQNKENDNFYEKKFYYEMKKIFSNLILIYMKLEKNKKCAEYISLFFHIFQHEYIIKKNKFKLDEIYEKVLYLEYKYLYKSIMYVDCKSPLIKLLSLYHVDFDMNRPKVFDNESCVEVEDKSSIIQRYSNYNIELENLMNLIKKSEEDKNNFFRKMFKY